MCLAIRYDLLCGKYLITQASTYGKLDKVFY